MHKNRHNTHRNSVSRTHIHTRTHTLRHSYTQSSIAAGLFSIPNIHCLATTYQETSSPPDQSSLPLKGSQSGELLPWDKLVWSRKKGGELVNMVSMSPAEISFPFPLSSFSLCFNVPLTQLSMSKHSNLILISPAPLFCPLTVCSSLFDFKTQTYFANILPQTKSF